MGFLDLNEARLGLIDTELEGRPLPEPWRPSAAPPTLCRNFHTLDPLWTAGQMHPAQPPEVLCDAERCAEPPTRTELEGCAAARRF